MTDLLRRKIEERTARVAVIGQGYVGLPLAMAFSRAGFPVLGLEVDAEKVAQLNAGSSYIPDVPSSTLREARSCGYEATVDPARLGEADAILITVPTPYTKTKQPDMTYVRQAVRAVAATLRPNTVSLRADSLIVFSEYLAAAHPDVRSLTQLTREHIEGFLAHNHKRPWRGRVARDQPVSAVVSKRTVIDLRCFLDDLALWGHAERPPARLLFPTDIPRLDRPLPRALPPDGCWTCIRSWRRG